MMHSDVLQALRALERVLEQMAQLSEQEVWDRVRELDQCVADVMGHSGQTKEQKR